ncbi:hypothetical protein [Mesobacillus jeotgali]|uniref:hypothetical protein n=1 Tax=Mesobacillus jeotgali TaxID=129985 RepID=UPI001591F161|nr:hypothetical protein [Mesobacillus jeotgali]
MEEGEKLSRKARDHGSSDGGRRKAVKKSSGFMAGLLEEGEKLSRKVRDSWQV